MAEEALVEIRRLFNMVETLEVFCDEHSNHSGRQCNLFIIISSISLYKLRVTIIAPC